MKILITGVSGQLGSEIKRDLDSGLNEIGELPLIYKNSIVEGISSKNSFIIIPSPTADPILL